MGKLGTTVISLYVKLSNNVHHSSVKLVVVLKVADDNRHLPKIQLRLRPGSQITWFIFFREFYQGHLISAGL